MCKSLNIRGKFNSSLDTSILSTPKSSNTEEQSLIYFLHHYCFNFYTVMTSVMALIYCCEDRIWPLHAKLEYSVSKFLVLFCNPLQCWRDDHGAWVSNVLESMWSGSSVCILSRLSRHVQDHLQKETKSVKCGITNNSFEQISSM